MARTSVAARFCEEGKTSFSKCIGFTSCEFATVISQIDDLPFHAALIGSVPSIWERPHSPSNQQHHLVESPVYLIGDIHRDTVLSELLPAITCCESVVTDNLILAW